MFVETITAPNEVWHHWTDRLRLFTDPPVALFASIAWDNGNGTISGVNIWDNPSVVAAEGKPDYKPVRHGEPVASYFRHASHG